MKKQRKIRLTEHLGKKLKIYIYDLCGFDQNFNAFLVEVKRGRQKSDHYFETLGGAAMAAFDMLSAHIYLEGKKPKVKIVKRAL